MSLTPGGPLSYPVTALASIPYVLSDRSPTSSDGNGYPLPSIWVNYIELDAFILVSNAQGVYTWVKMGGNEEHLEQFTLPDMTVITPDASYNININQGGGVSITGSGNSYTISSSGGHGLEWSVVTDATQSIESFNGYFANNDTGVTFTLPATASVGDSFAISGINAGGWTIAQNASQLIRVGDQVTTTGVTGTVTAADIGTSLHLVCYEEDVGFIATQGPQGELVLS